MNRRNGPNTKRQPSLQNSVKQGSPSKAFGLKRDSSQPLRLPESVQEVAEDLENTGQFDPRDAIHRSPDLPSLTHNTRGASRSPR